MRRLINRILAHRANRKVAVSIDARSNSERLAQILRELFGPDGPLAPAFDVNYLQQVQQDRDQTSWLSKVLDNLLEPSDLDTQIENGNKELLLSHLLKVWHQTAHPPRLTDTHLLRYEPDHLVMLAHGWREPSPGSTDSLWNLLETLADIPLSADVVAALRQGCDYDRMVRWHVATLPLAMRSESHVIRKTKEQLGVDIQLKDAYAAAYGRVALACFRLLSRSCGIYSLECRSFMGRDGLNTSGHRSLDDHALDDFWSSIADVAYDAGRYTLASTLYRRAAASATSTDVGGLEKPRSIDALVHSGMSLAQAGKYEAALLDLEEAERVVEDTFGPKSRYYSWVVATLGVLSYKMGRLYDAEWRLERAMQIWGHTTASPTDDHLPFPIGAIDALGAIFKETGNASRGEELARQLEEFVPPLTQSVDPHLMAAASIIRLSKTGAEEITQDNESVRLLGCPVALSLKRALVWRLVCEGDVSEAKRLFGGTEAQTRDMLGANHPALAEVLLVAATLDIACGSVVDANQKLCEADSVARSHGDEMKSVRLRALTANALLLFRIGGDRPQMLEQAWFLVQDANDIAYDVYLSQYRGASEERMWEVKEADRLLGPLMLAIGLQAVATDIIDATTLLEAVWRRKNRILDIVRSRETPVTRARAALALYRSALENNWMDMSHGDMFAKAPLSIRKEAGKIFLGRKAISWDTFCESSECPKDFCGIEFVRVGSDGSGDLFADCNDRLVGFVVQRDDGELSVRCVDLGSGKAGDELVARFRHALDTMPTQLGGVVPNRELGASASEQACAGEEFISAGISLRQRVLDPLGLASPWPNELTIATDSGLALIPFETLPFDDGSFLDDHTAVGYVGSLWEVAEFRRGEGSMSRGFVLGDPDYEWRARDLQAPSDACRHAVELLRREKVSFRPIRGTRKEAEGVAKLLGVTAWLGREATLDCFLRECDSTILHMATHGYFLADYSQHDARTPLQSLTCAGLVFAGANAALRSEESNCANGILTAADIAQVDLRSTELVVLSACETGIGVATQGEGVIGFRRAFWAAGVQTMIASLWRVPDDETVALMESFYVSISEGERCVDAIRYARRSLRAAGFSPRTWGAFVVQGNPDSLRLRPLGEAGSVD